MPHPYSCLAVLDIDKIHGYVFRPPRLRLIRGGSFIIDRFIRCLEKDLLCKPGRPYGFYVVLYSNGGAAEILFEDRPKAQAFIRETQWVLGEKTQGASLTGIVEEWNQCQSFQDCQQSAMVHLQRAKRMKRESLSLLTSIYAKSCEECGVHPATPFLDKTSKKHLCRSCTIKHEAFNRGERTEMVRFFEERSECEIKRPKDFSEIADKSKPSNYLGLIYVDGNRMGELKRKLLDADPYNYRKTEQFSLMVEKALFNAISDALRSGVGDPAQFDPFPVEFCLAGGDDAVLVLPADKALPVATEICKLFEQETENQVEGINKVSISAGVVIAKGNFPFAAMLETAEQLLKSAKRWSWDRKKADNEEISCIDFQLLDSGVLSLDEMRENLSSYKDAVRPHTVQDFEKMIARVREMKARGLPLGRLKTIQQARLVSREQALLEYCITLTRITDEQRKYLRQEFPIPEKTLLPMLPELLELFDFVPERQRGR